MVAVPVDFVIDTNPDGKTLEHGFLVDVASVPFPYGAPVENGTGTTVAVLMMTTTLAFELALDAGLDAEKASLLLFPATELTTPDEAPVVHAGVAVSV